MKKLPLFLTSISLFAGPPMITNDPFLPEGDFEINIATFISKDAGITTIVAPIIDANYVPIENLELTILTTHKTTAEEIDNHNESNSDFSYTEFAFKYHFLNTDFFDAAFVGESRSYPIATIHDEGEVFEVQLPMSFNISENLNFIMTPLYAYATERSENSHLEIGAYIKYELHHHTFLLEQLTEKDHAKDEYYYLMNVGHMYRINERYSTLFSIGQKLKTEYEQQHERGIFSYAGLQIRL